MLAVPVKFLPQCLHLFLSMGVDGSVGDMLGVYWWIYLLLKSSGGLLSLLALVEV